jgi:hypothetical protein
MMFPILFQVRPQEPAYAGNRENILIRKFTRLHIDFKKTPEDPVYL